MEELLVEIERIRVMYEDGLIMEQEAFSMVAVEAARRWNSCNVEIEIED